MTSLVPALTCPRVHEAHTVRHRVWSWIPGPGRAVISRWSAPVWEWLWATRWRRILIRAFVAWHMTGALLVLAAAPARADQADSVRDNPYFGWMTVEDSHGISIWRYFMSIDGGSASNPSAKFWSLLIHFEYEIYRFFAGLAIWVTGYVLSFDWVQILVEPTRVLGDALDTMTSQMNLSGVLLTAAGAIGGFWILRGRWATGLYEVVMAAVIAALAVGVLADPVERVAGHDGLIIQARDAGLELGAGLANNGNTDASPDELITQVKAEMADTMVRRPTQLLNFGQVIDTMEGPNRQACIEAFDAGFDDFEGNTRDTLKDNIRACEGGGDNFWDSNGGSMKEWADNPGSTQAFAGWVLIFGGGVLFLFALVLSAAVIMAAFTALYQSLKAIVMLILGILSGMARHALFKTASNLAISLVIMIFGVLFTISYMLILQAFFDSDGDNLIKKFLFVDALLVVGIVQFRRGVKGLRSMADGLAERLGKRPGGNPSPIARPVPSMTPLQTAYYASHVAGKTLGATKKAAQVTKAVGSTSAKIGQAVGNGTVTVAGAPIVAAAAAGVGVAKMVQAGKKKFGGSSSSEKPAPRRSSVPVAGTDTTGSGIPLLVATATPRASNRVLTPRAVSETFHEVRTPSGLLLALPTSQRVSQPKKIMTISSASTG